MTKKPRRSRVRHKRKSNPQPLASKEVGQPSQGLPISRKQAEVAKSLVTADEQAAQHQHVLSDLRRTLITAAVVFALLIVLYFILR